MGTIETFAAFAAGLRLGGLSAAQREILGLHLLDTMGAAIAGAHTPIGRALGALQTAGAGGARVFTPASIDDVARRVGTVRHTEVDDIHTASNVTPSAVVVPTALTMARRLGVSDPDHVGGALVAGYEAILRLGLAIDGPVVMYRGIWPTFFCAPFGAAAVTARLLGLAPEATAHALAIALTVSTGGAGRPGPGLPGRWLVVGEAARAGVAAALAAAAGFAADLALLDGAWLRQAHGLAGNPEALTRDLGAGSIVAELSVKPCCTGKQAAAALAAFRELLDDGLDAEAVHAIEVHVPPRYAAMIDRRLGAGPIQSTFGNVRYQFGLAAFHPEGLYDAARSEVVADPRLHALMDKVTVVADEALESHMPERWPARVEVTTPSGRLARTVVSAPGDPDRRFDAAALAEKVHRLADRLIGAAEAEAWIAAAAGAFADPAGLRRLGDRFEALFA